MADKRAYETSHAWIKFEFDLDRLTPQMWLQLGQVQAQCQQIIGAPLKPNIQKLLNKMFLAKGALATAAIEGNTLTEEEAFEIVEDKSHLPLSQSYLKDEIKNIIAAMQGIAQHIFSGQSADLTPEIILGYHRQILTGLPVRENVILGKYRSYTVGVGSYQGAPTEDLGYLMERLCYWLNHGWKTDSYSPMVIGILKALVGHLYLAWIHPFGDGNGRTARLMEFQILLASGVPFPAALLLSNHYNQTRSEYYRYLEIASARPNDGIYQFIGYALQGLIDQLSEQIDLIEGFQLITHWENFVHDQFRNKDGKADQRKRRLVLDLSRRENPLSPVRPSELRYISPRIAEAYANKTHKAVQRDINALKQMGLLRVTPQGVVPNIEIMRAFLPPTQTPPNQE